MKEVQSQSGSLKIVREHVNVTMNIIYFLSNGNIWWWTIKVEANVYEISRKEIKNQIEEMSNQEAYFLQKIKAFTMRKKKSDFLDYRLLTIFSVLILTLIFLSSGHDSYKYALEAFKDFISAPVRTGILIEL